MNLRDLRHRFPIAAVRAADVTASDVQGLRRCLLLDRGADHHQMPGQHVLALVCCCQHAACIGFCLSAVHRAPLTQGNAYAGLRVGPHLPHCRQQGKANLPQHLLHLSPRYNEAAPCHTEVDGSCQHDNFAVSTC
jgi:hypothetical protein